MSTTTIHENKDEKAIPAQKRRDDYQHLETPAHLGLVHDKDDRLTPIDALFNAKEASSKPKTAPREVL